MRVYVARPPLSSSSPSTTSPLPPPGRRPLSCRITPQACLLFLSPLPVFGLLLAHSPAVPRALPVRASPLSSAIPCYLPTSSPYRGRLALRTSPAPSLSAAHACLHARTPPAPCERACTSFAFPSAPFLCSPLPLPLPLASLVGPCRPSSPCSLQAPWNA